MRFEENVLRQVGGRVSVAGKSEAPARDAFVMALEQLVDEYVALAPRPFFRLGE